MDISFISNPVSSPVMVKNGFNPASVKAIDNKSATGNYTTFSTVGMSAVMLIITGTFVADVTVYGHDVNTNTNVRNKKIYNADTGLEIKDGIIKEAGTYFVANDVPFDAMYLRINAYTSGAVTAYAFDASQLTNSKAKRHIVEIAKSLGSSVSAESYGQPIQNLPISQFAFLVVVARTNANHAHRVAITYVHSNSLGSMSPEVVIFNSTSLRDGESDWLPVKGTTATFTIRNDDTSNSHTYDLVVYGVM